MKTSNRLKIAALSAVLPLAALSSAQAATSLNFVLPDNVGYESILNYYNGGADQNGAIGPNYGITFGSDALALLNANQPNDVGSNVGNEPGGGNAMIFLSGVGDVMDVAGGFNTGFSFYYAAPGYAGSVSVYSGLDGTGTLLASIPLPVTGGGPGPGLYSLWDPVGVTFAGTAESAIFSGDANYIAFADVTIGSGTPQIGNNVPDNTGVGIYALAALALAGAGWASRKQKIAAI
jgi:hypothetical protein